MTLSEGNRAKLISPMDCQTPLCYMSVIHLKAVTTTVSQIFDETVIFDLILTLPEGHRTKLSSPLDRQTQLASFTHAIEGESQIGTFTFVLQGVTAIENEIFNETVMIDLILTLS